MVVEVLKVSEEDGRQGGVHERRLVEKYHTRRKISLLFGGWTST